jgi:curved DNA-binding protein CbpA
MINSFFFNGSNHFRSFGNQFRSFSTVMQRKNHYDLLGVSRDANPNEIKKAYHTKCLTIHPDVNKTKNSHDQFVQITNAYDTLKDDEKRRDYDLSLSYLDNSIPKKRKSNSKNNEDNDYFDQGLEGETWTDVIANILNQRKAKQQQQQQQQQQQPFHFYDVFVFEGNQKNNYFRLNKGWKQTSDLFDSFFAGSFRNSFQSSKEFDIPVELTMNNQTIKPHKRKGKYSYKYQQTKPKRKSKKQKDKE